MSRGLGNLQKRILEAAAFTATIGEVEKPGDFTLEIEDAPGCAVKSFAGQEIQWRPGSGTWNIDGKPVVAAKLQAPASSIVEARKAFRWARLKAELNFNNARSHGRHAPEIAVAAAPRAALLATLFPELFAKDHRENDRLIGRLRVPDEIRKGKDSSAVLISRAVSSLCKRGILVESWCVLWSVMSMKTRGWRLPYQHQHPGSEWALSPTLFLLRRP